MLPPSWFAGRRFKVITTGLIAATTLLGAIGSWRATEANGDARASERKAVADQRAAVQQETVIRGALFATEYDYMRKTSLQAAAAELRRQAGQAAADDAARLLALAAAFDKAAVNQNIDPDALLPDGTLDLEAKYDLEWYAAQARQDLDPTPEFAAADRLRVKSERIVGLTALFVAAALFFTLADVSRAEASRRLYFFGGCGVGLLAVVLLVGLELA